ncbi:hypothetical protein [Methylomagnum ishizawai]|uniref:hypothetical protein n=1 Tax=Methylomagnum ishizawai TaxID=1760988 RepID=UPI000F73FB04|nr:hypothetical protein [Methylomagnum ishizawai]
MDQPRPDIPPRLQTQAEPASETPATTSQLRTAEPPPPASEPVPAAAQVAEPPAVAVVPVAAVPTVAPRPAWVPEDSVLRRHFMQHTALMAQTVAGPRPGDSVLIRHHGQLVQSRIDACLRDEASLLKLRADYAARIAALAVTAPPTPVAPTATVIEAPTPVEEPLVATTAAPIPAETAPVAAPPVRTPRPAWVPEDSVLRRHFMQHTALMAQTVAGPRPGDSVLIRHYGQLVQSRIDACLRDEASLLKLRADYAARIAALAVAAPPAPVAPTATAVETPTPVETPAAAQAPRPPLIPQDSVLRRHFLHHVLHMLKSVAPPRPTDSVLIRHYEQCLDSEFNACLRDPARLERLIARYGTSRTARAA